VTNIFVLMMSNMRRRPITLRFPDRLNTAKKYRGLVRMDPSKCIACGICDYVCVSSSITVEAHDDHCDWEYDPGRCTFCGRCVRYCPGEAIRQEEERPPAYDLAGALNERHSVDYPACTSCGEPTQPFNDTMLGVAFNAVTEEIRQKARLCNRCRKRDTQAQMKKSFVAPERKTKERS